MKKKMAFLKRMRTVLIITIGWTLFACVSFVSQHFFIYDLIALKKLSGALSFWNELMGTLVFGIIGGLTAGWLLVFKMGSRYRKKSFGFGIVNAGLLFIVTYVVLAGGGLFFFDFFFFFV